MQHARALAASAHFAPAPARTRLSRRRAIYHASTPELRHFRQKIFADDDAAMQILLPPQPNFGLSPFHGPSLRDTMILHTFATLSAAISLISDEGKKARFAFIYAIYIAMLRPFTFYFAQLDNVRREIIARAY